MKNFKYNKDSHVTAIEDVKEFIRYVIKDCGVNWNPDDDASVYIDLETKKPTFTEEQVEIINRLTEECFDVANADKNYSAEWVYDYAFDLITDYLKFDDEIDLI